MSSFQLNQDHVSALRLSFRGFKNAGQQLLLTARESSSRAVQKAQGPHTITSGLLRHGVLNRNKHRALIS